MKLHRIFELPTYCLYMYMCLHTTTELLSYNTVALKCHKQHIASAVYSPLFFVYIYAIGFTQEQINHLIVLELKMFVPWEYPCTPLSNKHLFFKEDRNYFRSWEYWNIPKKNKVRTAFLPFTTCTTLFKFFQ